jgi:transposase
VVWFVGIDWAAETHAVCVLDERGGNKRSWDVAHSRAGVADLCRRLGELGEPGDVRVAIERPSGLLVDTLVDAGLMLVPLHPNAVKACRPRYSAAGCKDDRGDAFMLADILRTDGHRFRALQPSSDATRALRAATRTREDLVAERVAVANQLRALLEGFWPGAAEIFADVDSPIALAFLARYPSPQRAARLGEKRLARFLADHGYCGRRPVPELLERLRAAPAGKAGVIESDAKASLALAYVAVLVPLVEQIGKLTALVERLLGEHPDGSIVASFPRAGKVNAAQLLAELGDCRDRFATDEQLAAEAGVAPVTHESGKHRSVVFRHACNKRLRKAVTCWADNSRHASPWAADVYRRARERGHDHPHAVRVLARAWTRVLWRCWHDRKLYDAALHGGTKRVVA